jgi:hypothetical protein
MEPLMVIYLCLTIILLIVFGIVIHDKIVDRQERRTRSSGQDTENRQGPLLRQVIVDLGELPDDASFTQIKAVLDRAAFQTVPETIRCRALEVFGDEVSAAEWLTTRITAMGGQTPIDILTRAEGEEELLKVLGRIEHGVFSGRRKNRRHELLLRSLVVHKRRIETYFDEMANLSLSPQPLCASAGGDQSQP